MGELRKSFSQIGVPLATGEMLYTKFEFRDLLVRNAADIVQPDICCAGGLLEQRKIAAMAEAFYVTVAPHNPMGPVATMVNVHFCVCTPNFLILEYNPDDRPDRGILVDEPATVVGGYIEAPTKPGLGIDLNVEAYTAERCFKRWHRAWPIGPDGAMRYP